MFLHGAAGETSTGQKHLRTNIRWAMNYDLWLNQIWLIIPESYALLSGIYYLLPTYQKSLCLRALLTPLEKKFNISQMFKHHIQQDLKILMQHSLVKSWTSTLLPLTKAMFSPRPTLFFTLLTNLRDRNTRGWSKNRSSWGEHVFALQIHTNLH